ncbi:hypothetical protein ACFX2H_033343 [Malus domestica]
MASTSTTLILLTFTFLAFQCQPFTLTMKRHFSGFYYTEVYIGNPSVKANLARGTGSGPVWGLDIFKFNTAIAEHQETIDVTFGLSLFNKILNFADHDRHPNIMAEVIRIGRSYPSSFLLQLSPITQMKVSYCLPRRIGDKAALHFGINQQETQIVRMVVVCSRSDVGVNSRYTGVRWRNGSGLQFSAREQEQTQRWATAGAAAGGPVQLRLQTSN